jgi:hypothetical protein
MVVVRTYNPSTPKAEQEDNESAARLSYIKTLSKNNKSILNLYMHLLIGLTHKSSFLK